MVKSTDSLPREQGAGEGMWHGVDINHEDIADHFQAFVWEPAMVRINTLTAAAEAACLIVFVDGTLRNPTPLWTPQLQQLARPEAKAASTERQSTHLLVR